MVAWRVLLPICAATARAVCRTHLRAACPLPVAAMALTVAAAPARHQVQAAAIAHTAVHPPRAEAVTPMAAAVVEVPHTAAVMAAAATHPVAAVVVA